VNVDVPLAGSRRAALVPVTSVRRSAFGAHVFVLEPAEEGAGAAFRAAQRQVSLGPQQGEEVIVISGLEPGEKVAADGSFKLRDGVLVLTSEQRSLSAREPVPAGA
jgi:membrane fusion protein (multidrug efflux system)